MSIANGVSARLARWQPWRDVLSSNAPEAFGAIGSLAGLAFGLVQLIAPTIHTDRSPGVVGTFPPESWGLAFVIVSLWLFIMCFTPKRDDMEAPALLVSLLWGLYGVLAVIPNAHAATPSAVVLVFAATAEAAAVSLMAGGSPNVRTRIP